MDIFSTIVNVAQTAEYAWELYSLIKDARKVDEKVNSIAAEVEGLGSVCKLSHAELKRIVDDFTQSTGGPSGTGAAPFEQFWKCINSQLDGCSTIVRRLTEIIKPLKRTRKSYMRDLYHQLQLRLSEDEIRDMRSQMNSHSTTLSVALEALSMKVQYLSLRRIDDKFHIRLETLENKVLNAIETWGNSLQTSLSQQSTGLPQPTVGSGNPNSSAPVNLQPLHDDAQTLHSSVHNGFVRLLSIADSYKNEGYSFSDVDEDRVYLLGFVEEVVSESGRTLEQNADGWETVVDGTARQLDIGRSGVDIANWIDLQPSASHNVQTWVQAPPTLPRSAYSVAGDRYYPIEPTLDTLPESDESDDDENVEMSKWTLQAAQQAYEEAHWLEAYDYFRVGLQLFQQRPLKHQHRSDFWESRYKLAICAFQSQPHIIAEENLRSFAAAEADDDDQRLLQCKAGLLLAKVYARQGRLELAQRSCRTARRGIQKLKGSDHSDVHDALALQSTLYTLNGSEESLRNAKICAFQIPHDMRDVSMRTHSDLLLPSQQHLPKQNEPGLEKEARESKEETRQIVDAEKNENHKIEETEEEQLEREIAEIEAAEREEEERERLYTHRKRTEREIMAALKAKEDVEADDELKRLEREAEEREEQIQLEREGADEQRPDEESKALFAGLKKLEIGPGAVVETETYSTIDTSGSTTGGETSTVSSSLMHNDSSATTVSRTGEDVDAETHVRNATEAFRQFANDQKLRSRQKAEAKRNGDMATKEERLADLKKFAANFKLKSRVPDDLVPILARDQGKQLEIQLRADNLARDHENMMGKEAIKKFMNPSNRPTSDIEVNLSQDGQDNREAKPTVSSSSVGTAFVTERLECSDVRSNPLQTDLGRWQQQFQTILPSESSASNTHATLRHGQHASSKKHETWSEIAKNAKRQSSSSSTLPSQPAGQSKGQQRRASFAKAVRPHTTHYNHTSHDQATVIVEPFASEVAMRRAWLNALCIWPRGSSQWSLVAPSLGLRLFQHETEGNGFEVTSWHLAALFGNVEYCRQSLTKDKNARCRIASKYTYGNQSVRPVDLAMATGRAEIVLLADPRFMTHSLAMEGEPSYGAAAYLFHGSWLKLTGLNPLRALIMLETMIPHLFSVNSWMNDKLWSLLHFAVSRSQECLALREATTAWLLDHGASRIARTTDGNLPLHLASKLNETSETVELLLRAEADAQLDAINDHGQTALDLAVKHRIRNRIKVGLEVINSLLTAGKNEPKTRLSLESMIDVVDKANDRELKDLLMSFK